jgi:NAD(P)-dependent dehydrogenase (short-subunit alcohol dehydrogenase family)
MNRNILIIGASSGIGRATALRLARDGDRLVLMSRDERTLSDVAALCSEAGAGEVMVAAGDALRPADLQRGVDAALADLGGLDGVVHTAAVMAYGRVETLPADVFAAVVDTAIMGTFHTARAVLPVFRRQHRGTLLFVNSLLGSVTVPNMGAYATSKWGQRAVIRTLQQETRDEPEIHVGMLSPGSLNTPIYYLAANYMNHAARPPVPVLQPERAAESLRRMLDRPRGNVSVPVGPANPIVITGFRLLPALYDATVGPLFKLAALARGSQEPTEGNVHKATPELEEVHGHWPDR